MAECYNCSVPLTDGNRSIEHIIPNAMGGRLKSSDLLCRPCNTKLADLVDGPLIEQFSGITALLDTQRERGSAPEVEGTLPDGTALLIAPGGKPGPKHPVYQEKQTAQGKEIHFEARSEKEMAAFIRSILKKYPQVDAAEICGAVQRGVTYVKDPVKIPFTFGGAVCFRGALKIALQFHIVRVGMPAGHERLLDIVSGNAEPGNLVCFSQGFDPFGIDGGDTVTHSISLVGAHGDRLVYAHVTLFSFIRLIVVLDESYGGEDFLHAYAQNAVTRAEIPMVRHGVLSRDDIATRRASSEWPPACFHSEMNRVVGVGVAAMELLQMKQLFGDCLQEWGRKHEGKLITEEMVDELVGRYRTALEQWLSR